MDAEDVLTALKGDDDATLADFYKCIAVDVADRLRLVAQTRTEANDHAGAHGVSECSAGPATDGVPISELGA